MKNIKKFAGGFVTGVAIGVTAGMLLAPTSGPQTRERISSGSRKLKNNIKNYVDDSLEVMRRQINGKIDKLAKDGKQLVNDTTEKVKV
jgi:gas vesicle protein